MSKRKIEDQERIKIIEAYFLGEIGFGEISNRYGIPKSTLRRWINNYKIFGADGLRRKERHCSYSAEIKRQAVKEYQSGNSSLWDICTKYKIYSDSQLRNWIKMYNGHEELRSSRGRGSDIYMTKGRRTTYEERIEIVSYCIKHDNNYTATIEKYGVSYQQIYSWVKKYHKEGVEGLVDKRGKRKKESEMTELEKLRAENQLLAAKNKRLEMENAVLKKLEEIERRWH